MAKQAVNHPSVYIDFDHYANGVIKTRFAGQISIINGGEVGQNGIFCEAFVKATVGEKRWFAFA
jgi:hypothetical protein